MRVLLAALLALAVAGCGEDSPSGGGRSDRDAAEAAARSYIVSEQSDEDDPEEAAELSFTSVDVQGDSARVVAESRATGNRYEVDLSKSGNSWRGTAVLTDRPAEPGGDPAGGPGQRASTDEVETQIEQRLLKPARVKGQVECPPEIRIRRGNDFTCKVVGASRPVTVEVTQKDDQGNLGYKLSAGSR